MSVRFIKSILAPRTSHLAPRTSHLAPRTSHLAPRTSHLATANRIVVNGSDFGRRATNTHFRSRCVGRERCVELARLHASRMVEPYPDRRRVD
jgi:hypothetical protein